MSKIRNLFNKFKKKSTTDVEVDLDELDNQDITGEYQIDEFEDSDENFEESDQVLATEDATGDIPIFRTIEDTEEYIQEIDDDDDDDTDYLDEHQTGTHAEHILDLENGKVPLKDKLKDAFDSFKASLHRFKLSKPKKMKVLNIDKDNDNSDEKSESASSKLSAITTKIKLPASFQSLEKNLKHGFKKINWTNLHNDFFQAARRQDYHRIFQVTTVILVTYALGKSTALLLKGKSNYKNLKKNTSLNIDKSNALTPKKITQLKSAKLFRTESMHTDGPIKKKVIKTDIACKRAVKKSRLPIKLVNTIVLQDSVKSIAAVQVRSDSLLRELRIGENINGLAKIDRIERHKLIIKNLQSGVCESIETEGVDHPKNPIAVMSPKQSTRYKKNKKNIKGIKNDGNNFVIEKAFLSDKMSNISSILTEARGIQITNPDGTISFKIVDIKPGGLFSYLGITNNDIITQINGQPITDLNMVMSLFGKVTSLDKLNLMIKRGGSEMPLNYKFK